MPGWLAGLLLMAGAGVGFILFILAVVALLVWWERRRTP